MATFNDLFLEVAETAFSVFADATAVQHLQKLKTEAQETIEQPDNVEEYADCLIALLGAAAKQGIQPKELMDAAINKNYLNRTKRTWAKKDGMYQHVEKSNDDNQEGWVGEKVECEICTHEWAAVFPEGTPSLECPHCGNFTIVR